jgi:hypothetical protein
VCIFLIVLLVGTHIGDFHEVRPLPVHIVQLLLVLVQYETLHPMKIFGEPASGFEVKDGRMSSGMVDYLHTPVLFYPEFPHDDVVNTAVHVSPSVGLAPSEIETMKIRIEYLYLVYPARMRLKSPFTPAV